MDSRNFAIGVLSTTAVVLFAALAVILSTTPPASASGVTANAGAYILTVGSVAVNDEELLYITHAQSRRVGIYRFDAANRRVDLVDGIDLTTLAQPGAGQPSGRRP